MLSAAAATQCHHSGTHMPGQAGDVVAGVAILLVGCDASLINDARPMCSAVFFAFLSLPSMRSRCLLSAVSLLSCELQCSSALLLPLVVVANLQLVARFFLSGFLL